MIAKPSNQSTPNVSVTPYLYFKGHCDEALEYYQRALGATVSHIFRFKDSPDQAACPPGWEDKVMHSSFRIGKAEILVSDGSGDEKAGFDGFSLALTVPGEAEAEQYFAALADGGRVRMPLTKTFFSPRFGMVADRFGVLWMVYVAPERE